MVKRGQMIISVDYDNEIVIFEHSPCMGLSSEGRVSFKSIDSICKGDWNTPTWVDTAYKNFEFDELTVWNEDREEIQDVPKDYIESILDHIINEI